MEKPTQPTKEDLDYIETTRKEAIKLIKDYKKLYNGKVHYYELGSSCVQAATKTVDTIIDSTNYLEGKFVMPDEIHVERLTEWFMQNRDYQCDPTTLTMYFAKYSMKKVNELYKNIQQGNYGISSYISRNSLTRKQFEEGCRKRYKEGVKQIRR
ncbi:hypothetical protein GLW08_21280 [Pontibacillus yanchengensis]|uniref:Uncharacterized protein n=2 Tax=Pontibacillus yanchengensis TaxID=462910 RepID=A0ACC7VLF9_9BACI|nr:hypothetical protein [Pontibacillus yanchengensis]MYL35417.1 hypothetical protein [Pontibacillus yanchengensis]MYL55836.1 hypothetical protein [Pontibacillus yanchengensis]